MWKTGVIDTHDTLTHAFLFEIKKIFVNALAVWACECSIACWVIFWLIQISLVWNDFFILKRSFII